MDIKQQVKDEIRTLFSTYNAADLNSPDDVKAIKSLTINAILSVQNGILSTKGHIKFERKTRTPKIIIRWKHNNTSERLEVLLRPARFHDPFEAYHRAMSIV